MSEQPKSPLPRCQKARPLLIAAAGVAAIVVSNCGPIFTSGNLIAPPCDAGGFCEPTDSGADAGPPDAGKTDGGDGG